MPNKLSVYIITYNQKQKLKDALESVKWADEIVVVDSHSTDGTIELAKSYGAKLVQVDFQGFGHLRNEAVKACSYDWVFSLDTDERSSEEAKNEILAIVNSPKPDYLVYMMPRVNYFMGKQIRYSWPYPDYRQPQLFKKGTLVYHDDAVHEGYSVKPEYKIGHLKNPIWQIPYEDFNEFFHKMNRYSSLGAKKLKANQKTASMSVALMKGLATAVKHFILKLGFLDGWAGFVIAINNFYYTFFRYAKLYELDNDIHKIK